MWGGIFVIVPVVTAIFAIFGALIGGGVEYVIRLKYPTGDEL